MSNWSSNIISFWGKNEDIKKGLDLCKGIPAYDKEYVMAEVEKEKNRIDELNSDYDAIGGISFSADHKDIVEFFDQVKEQYTGTRVTRRVEMENFYAEYSYANGADGEKVEYVQGFNKQVDWHLYTGDLKFRKNLIVSYLENELGWLLDDQDDYASYEKAVFEEFTNALRREEMKNVFECSSYEEVLEAFKKLLKKIYEAE